MSTTSEAILCDETRALESRVRRKIDMQILPALCLTYLVFFLDRINIGNAKIAGLVEDTHLTGTQFNVGLTVYYILNVALQIPFVWLLKKVGANRWFAGLICIWSVITICTGFIQNFGGLLVVRLLLGAFEGSVLPGLMLYMSTIYTRPELATRIAFFWAPASTAGAFGGLLASAIILMDGIGGLAGWRWLFIIEGIASFLVGVLIWAVVPRDIESARFLTPEERIIATIRLKTDKGVTDEVGVVWLRSESDRGSLGDAKDETKCVNRGEIGHAQLSMERVQSTTLPPQDEEFEWREVRRGILDLSAWLLAFSFFGVFVALTSLSYFVPSMIAGLGYRGSEAQLRTVPPYVVATVSILGVGIAADRLKARIIIVMAVILVAIVGYVIAIIAKTDEVRYGAFFLMAFGVYTPAAPTLAILPSNTSGHYKRATALGLCLAVETTGGFLSTFVYTPDQAPHYKKGHSIVLGLLCMSFLLYGATLFYYIRENKARAAGRRDDNIAAYRELWEAGKTRAPIGDRHPGFRYAL